MKVEIKLIPPKNGKLEIGKDRKVYYVNNVPHKLEILVNGEIL